MFGFGLIFGTKSNENIQKLSGTGYWAVDVDVATEASVYTQTFFHLSFSTTATTIVSGGFWERRLKFEAILLLIE